VCLFYVQVGLKLLVGVVYPFFAGLASLKKTDEHCADQALQVEDIRF